MLSNILLSAAMVAGVIAAPVENRAIKVEDIVVPVAVTVTAGNIPAAATPTATSNNNGGGFLEQPQPVVTPVAVPVPVVTSAPAPVTTPAASSSSSSSGSSGNDLLDTVNYWRRQYNLNDLVWDDNLASQATQVGQEGGGVNEVHHLIPGLDMGQVIAPGQINPVPVNQQGQSPFDVVYAAWLCEVPTDPELSAAENDGVDMCSLVQDILHMVYTDDGHHNIIVTPSWNSVGCGYAANPSADQETATYQGLWTCNYST